MGAEVGRTDGWVDGLKAILRIAYSNVKWCKQEFKTLPEEMK